MAKNFDVLIGLHAHGLNMKIIKVVTKYKKGFILMPCCVIDESITLKPNINWMDFLEKYANNLGMRNKHFELNFKGQNIGFYSKNI